MCGADHQCQQASCVPTTCSAEEATCGTVPDGCGAFLQCGSCADGASCDANVCVPDPQPAASEWSASFEGLVWGAARDSAGETFALYVLTVEGVGAELHLVRFSPSGEQRWDRIVDRAEWFDFGFNQRALVVSGGAVFIGGTRPDGLFVLKLDAEAGPLWSYSEPGRTSAIGVSAGGEVVVVNWEWVGDSSTVVRLDASGKSQSRWRIDLALSAAFSPDGALVVGGRVSDPPPTEGPLAGAAGNEGFVLKLDASGETLWRGLLSGSSSSVWSVDTSAKGTVVGGVSLGGGSFQWAGQSYSHESGPGNDATAVVIVAEASGAHRWSEQDPSLRFATVDVSPEGQLGLLKGWEHCSAVSRWELTGEKVFSKSLGECNAHSDEVFAEAVYVDPTHTLVGGGFAGKQSFGEAPPMGSNSRPTRGFIRTFVHSR